MDNFRVYRIIPSSLPPYPSLPFLFDFMSKLVTKCLDTFNVSLLMDMKLSPQNPRLRDLRLGFYPKNPPTSSLPHESSLWTLSGSLCPVPSPSCRSQTRVPLETSSLRGTLIPFANRKTWGLFSQ